MVWQTHDFATPLEFSRGQASTDPVTVGQTPLSMSLTDQLPAHHKKPLASLRNDMPITTELTIRKAKGCRVDLLLRQA